MHLFLLCASAICSSTRHADAVHGVGLVDVMQVAVQLPCGLAAVLHLADAVSEPRYVAHGSAAVLW